jgi:hypothetical protein
MQYAECENYSLIINSRGQRPVLNGSFLSGEQASVAMACASSQAEAAFSSKSDGTAGPSSFQCP